MMALERGIANEGDSRPVLERDLQAADRLAAQLDELTEVVRRDLAGGQAEPRIVPIPVAALFARLAEAHAAAALKGLQLRIVESSQVVASDVEGLLTILNNLVMNAVNYTTRGKVLIGCRRHGGLCRMEVRDTGPGIAPKNQKAIFEGFRRLDDGQQVAGLGLGLTIVKETAAFLGVRVSLSSVPGKGSCFWLEVPLWTGR